MSGLLELYSAADLAGFPAIALAVLQQTIPSTFASYHEIGAGSTCVRHLCKPERHAETSERLRPLVLSSRDGETKAPRAGMFNQLTFALHPSPTLRRVFALVRIGATFSDSERGVAALLRLHLVRAHEIVTSSVDRRDPSAGEADAAGASAFLKRRFGLTRREAELLYWLARGKSNREMAIIFGISTRTVDKHLQHVFEKLDVESRHAAVVQALEAIGSA